MSPARQPELNGHFDLDAAAQAAIAEATGRPFRFTYKGELYEIPNQRLWPLDAAERLSQDGDMGAFLESLGAKGLYDKLADAGMTIGELNILMDAAGEDAGLGNLPSSRPRARRGSTRT